MFKNCVYLLFILCVIYIYNPIVFNLLEVFTTLNSKSVQYLSFYNFTISISKIYVTYTLICIVMDIISYLFIIISLNSINCDVLEHYYLFVIDSVYYFIKIYVILSICKL